MSDEGRDEREAERARVPGIEQHYDLDAPPEKVWRAITIPAFRERWLPGEALAEPEAVTVSPGTEASYRLREREPPFLESLVTFRVAPNGTGGTHLRILHRPAETVAAGAPGRAANGNAPPRMRAA